MLCIYHVSLSQNIIYSLETSDGKSGDTILSIILHVCDEYLGCVSPVPVRRFVNGSQTLRTADRWLFSSFFFWSQKQTPDRGVAFRRLSHTAIPQTPLLNSRFQLYAKLRTRLGWSVLLAGLLVSVRWQKYCFFSSQELLFPLFNFPPPRDLKPTTSRRDTL